MGVFCMLSSHMRLPFHKSATHRGLPRHNTGDMRSETEQIGSGLKTVQKLQGAILGTAVGDAIGLPREGLSRRRAMRLFGGPPLNHRLVLGCGMISDDTEHTCMTAQALLSSKGVPEKFSSSLAWRFRFWLLGLPAAVGRATALSILKLWIGFSSRKSGVFSAGNGPAMGAVIIGAYAAGDAAPLRAHP